MNLENLCHRMEYRVLDAKRLSRRRTGWAMMWIGRAAVYAAGHQAALARQNLSYAIEQIRGGNYRSFWTRKHATATEGSK